MYRRLSAAQDARKMGPMSHAVPCRCAQRWVQLRQSSLRPFAGLATAVGRPVMRLYTYLSLRLAPRR